MNSISAAGAEVQVEKETFNVIDFGLTEAFTLRPVSNNLGLLLDVRMKVKRQSYQGSSCFRLVQTAACKHLAA